MEVSEMERKDLSKLYDRLQTHLSLVNGSRKNKKMLKLCRRIVKLEIKGLHKTKALLTSAQFQTVEWYYCDLENILPRLMKKNVFVVGKAGNDLDGLIVKIAAEEEKLKRQGEKGGIPDEMVQAVSDKIAEQIGKGTQKLGEMVGAGLEKLKSTLKCDDD